MIKNAGILGLVALLVLGVSGCVPLLLAGGAVAGAGAQTWVSGKLIQDLEAPFDEVFEAAKYALDSLSLPIASEAKKARIAQIKSTYLDGETVWIDIRKMSESISRVAVRVGAIPDRDASAEILDKIEEYSSK